MHKIFINDFGRLRSGWRLLIFIAAFIASLLILITVLRVGFVIAIQLTHTRPESPFVGEIIYRLSLLGSALGAGYLCARFLEGLPWRSLGLTFHTGWLRDLLI